MLADPEHVEPYLLCQYDLLEEVSHPFCSALLVQLGEGVDADLHRLTLAVGRSVAA